MSRSCDTTPCRYSWRARAHPIAPRARARAAPCATRPTARSPTAPLRGAHECDSATRSPTSRPTVRALPPVAPRTARAHRALLCLRLPRAALRRSSTSGSSTRPTPRRSGPSERRPSSAARAQSRNTPRRSPPQSTAQPRATARPARTFAEDGRCWHPAPSAGESCRSPSSRSRIACPANDALARPCSTAPRTATLPRSLHRRRSGPARTAYAPTAREGRRPQAPRGSRANVRARLPARTRSARRVTH